jgi:hypothetical protein
MGTPTFYCAGCNFPIFFGPVGVSLENPFEYLLYIELYKSEQDFLKMII